MRNEGVVLRVPRALRDILEVYVDGVHADLPRGDLEALEQRALGILRLYRAYRDVPARTDTIEAPPLTEAAARHARWRWRHVRWPHVAEVWIVREKTIPWAVHSRVHEAPVGLMPWDTPMGWKDERVGGTMRPEAVEAILERAIEEAETALQAIPDPLDRAGLSPADLELDLAPNLFRVYPVATPSRDPTFPGANIRPSLFLRGDVPALFLEAQAVRPRPVGAFTLPDRLRQKPNEPEAALFERLQEHLDAVNAALQREPETVCAFIVRLLGL